MPKLDLVYVGKFTVKDLDHSIRRKYELGDLSIDDICLEMLLDESQKYMDRCRYAEFVNGSNKKILKNFKL